jgi:hypothetical protein
VQPRHLDSLYIKEASKSIDLKSQAIICYAKASLFKNMSSNEYDKQSIETIQHLVNHKNASLDDVKCISMMICSLKNLNRKASKGNLKSYRIKIYFDNLIHGLADLLAHSDL